jgi:phospholipid-binding lipoprotein MlaA
MQSWLLPLALLVAEPVAPAPPPTEAATPTIVVPADPAQAPATQPTTTKAGEPEIVVTAEPGAPPGDPLQEVNAAVFGVSEDMDEALVEPVAKAYEKVAPRGVRRALRNVFRNLREPIVAVNYLLQLKVGKAFETVGRFGINSTIGLGGIIDVAEKKPFNLPRRPNGFANTLGFYGVKPGAYFYLPLIGSTTVRDLFGGTVDALFLASVLPAPIDKPIVTIPAGTLSALDYRIENDEAIRALYDESANPYRDAREAYLARRQSEIDALRGKVAAPIVAPVAEPGPVPSAEPANAPDPAPVP